MCVCSFLVIAKRKMFCILGKVNNMEKQAEERWKAFRRDESYLGHQTDNVDQQTDALFDAGTKTTIIDRGRCSRMLVNNNTKHLHV